jgi:hypothetical protein
MSAGKFGEEPGKGAVIQVQALKKFGVEELLDHLEEDMRGDRISRVGVENDPKTAIGCFVGGIIDPLPEGREPGEFIRIMFLQPCDEPREQGTIPFLLFIDPPPEILGGHDIFRGLVRIGEDSKSVVDVGQGIDEIKMKYRVPEGCIVEDEGFLIEVLQHQDIIAVRIHGDVFSPEF